MVSQLFKNKVDARATLAASPDFVTPPPVHVKAPQSRHIALVAVGTCFVKDPVLDHLRLQ